MSISDLSQNQIAVEHEGVKLRRMTIGDWAYLSEQMPGDDHKRFRDIIDWISETPHGAITAINLLSVGTHDPTKFVNALEWVKAIQPCLHLPKDPAPPEGGQPTGS